MHDLQSISEILSNFTIDNVKHYSKKELEEIVTLSIKINNFLSKIIEQNRDVSIEQSETINALKVQNNLLNSLNKTQKEIINKHVFRNGSAGQDNLAWQ